MKWAFIMVGVGRFLLPSPSLDGVGRSGSTSHPLHTFRPSCRRPAMWDALREGWARQWMMGLICACTCYIAIQIFMQALFGHNLFGVPRAADGTLTGPYTHSRAAGPYHGLRPPRSCWFFRRALHPAGGAARRSSGCYSASPVLTAMILAGQRMPTALMLLGMTLCALLYRPYRWVGLIGLMTTPVIMLASKSSPTAVRII